MLIITGEESNYHILEKVLVELKHGDTSEEGLELLINKLDKFLEPKRKIESAMSKMSRLARQGDKEAAKKLISTMAQLNDGP